MVLKHTNQDIIHIKSAPPPPPPPPGIMKCEIMDAVLVIIKI
jgi:hypothetical protein